MKFEDFRNIVLTNRDDIEDVSQHFKGVHYVTKDSKGNRIGHTNNTSDFVTVTFKNSNKSFDYRGSYVDVLNKLNIKAMYKEVYEGVVKQINYYKDELTRLQNGEQVWIIEGFIEATEEDTKRRIAEEEERIKDVVIC